MLRLMQLSLKIVIANKLRTKNKLLNKSGKIRENSKKQYLTSIAKN